MKDQIRRLIQVIVVSCLLIVITVSAGAWQPDHAAAQPDIPPPPDKEGRVEAAVSDALQANQSADYILVVGEQADLSRAYEITDWVERGRFVLEALQSTAARSQQRAIIELENRGLRYRSFIAGNEIYVFGGDSRALQAVLEYPEVAHVRAPAEAKLQPVGFLLNPFGPAAPMAQVQSVTDWGITDSKADQFWSAYQRTGEGIIVANLDTGVDVTHLALSGAYRCAGGDLTDPACWFDPTGVCAGTICDNHGHGTHTMGTMAASNDPSLDYTVGMAPGVEWIACKACASNDCADVDLLACADWILAPDGDPANRPHVVNNSWGDYGGNDWFKNKVDAWRAAGIFPAFSAGNFYSCNSLGSPGDYQGSFSTAAHRIDPVTLERVIADYSSKGPSFFGNDPYTKPNLSAPGSSIISAWTTTKNTWAYSSGTSMASPHTAGAVALLWSCAPGLVGQLDATFELLQSSADPAPDGACGAPASGEGNYTYGYGYLNVLAAGSSDCTIGLIKGIVRKAISGEPLAGVSIRVKDGILSEIYTTTAQDGSYEILLPQGSYDLKASSFGYLPEDIYGLEVLNGKVTMVDILLSDAQLIMIPIVLK